MPLILTEGFGPSEAGSSQNRIGAQVLFPFVDIEHRHAKRVAKYLQIPEEKPYARWGNTDPRHKASLR